MTVVNGSMTATKIKTGAYFKGRGFISKRYVPTIVVSIAASIVLYLFLWSYVKITSYTMTHYRGEEVFYLPWLFGQSKNVSFLWIIVFMVVSFLTWLLSTRVKFFKKPFMRVVMFMLPVIGSFGFIGAFGMSQMRLYVLPYFIERIENLMTLDGNIESIIYAHSHGFLFTLVIIPLLIQLFIFSFLVTKYQMFDKEIKEAFFKYEWKGNWLRKFSDFEKTIHHPDISLGPNVKTGEVVVLPGFDRTLGTAIIGAIGSGKTAALALPILLQDIKHMVSYINRFEQLIEMENYESKEVSGRELSGISVIEPSNDLCQKVLKLAKANGLPDEAITYIDPTNPDTPSLNAMRGPVDKVAEVFAQVIAGLNDSKQGGNFFFEQAQRIHLKQFIYLLKLHDPDKDVVFDDLIDMYNNTQLVRRMYEQFVKRFPEDIDSIENRDERNYWKIVQGVKEWFDDTIVPVKDNRGVMVVDSNNQPIYEDTQAQYVQGLRNILNDIAANPLIRRVLFGKSEFDFDKHMAMGGLLLVNTAKGELENLGRVLGKIVLMNLQNATFRRKPDVSTYHHVIVDEVPEYLYHSFASYPAQSRKYKVIITTLQQTIAQMSDAFGEHYMTTILAALRNRMVYGDVPTYDAKYFSEMFGEKHVYQEGMSEQSVSPLQEDPMSRSGSSYQKVREQAMTTGEIMYQKAFYCAVKIVVDNEPMPVQQIKANFVPEQEFIESEVVVNEEAAAFWLDKRGQYVRGERIGGDKKEIVSIEQTEIENQETYAMEKGAAESHQERSSESLEEPVVPVVKIKPVKPTYSEDDLHPRKELSLIPPKPPVRQMFVNAEVMSENVVASVHDDGSSSIKPLDTDAASLQTKLEPAKEKMTPPSVAQNTSTSVTKDEEEQSLHESPNVNKEVTSNQTDNDEVAVSEVTEKNVVNPLIPPVKEPDRGGYGQSIPTKADEDLLMGLNDHFKSSNGAKEKRS